MTFRALRITTALAVAVLVVAAAPAAPATLPSIYVLYGSPSCTFTITVDGGARISSIAPGFYQIIFDETPSNFDSCNGLPSFLLSGPGVSLATPVDNGTGADARYTLTFQPSSTYVAQDLGNPALSRVTFTTTATGTPTAPASPGGAVGGTTTTTQSGGSHTVVSSGSGATKTTLGTLDGAVTAAGALTLSLGGKPVTRITAGRYTLTVVDQSKTAGFFLQQLGKTAVTASGGAFTGKRTTTVVLAAGQSLYYPSFAGKKSSFTVVAASG